MSVSAVEEGQDGAHQLAAWLLRACDADAGPHTAAVAPSPLTLQLMP